MTPAEADEIREILDVLIEKSKNPSDFADLQIFWAENLHLFPSNLIPPLKLPNKICFADFRPEVLETLKQYEKHINNISDYLYYKNVTRTKDPEKAKKLFQEEILALLKKQEKDLKQLFAKEPLFPKIDCAEIVD